MSKKVERPQGADIRRSPPPDPTTLDRARRLIADCQDLVRAIAREHGLTPGELAPLERLTLRVPLDLATRPSSVPSREDPAAQEGPAVLVADLTRQILDATEGQTAFKLGHVYCFQCNSPDCGHSHPTDPTETFAGYLPTGKPTWKTFTNLCLERKEPRIDEVFSEPPQVISVLLWGWELAEGLLPAFRRKNQVYRLLGQVVAGLVPADLTSLKRPGDRLALTLQVLETQAGRRGCRLRLNLIGLSPDDISAAVSRTGSRDPPERLRRLVMDARQRLDTAGYHVFRSNERGEPVEVMKQVEPILVKLKSDIEHIFRPQRQRTEHAQDRHRAGQRPTSNALQDARQASDEKLFLDTVRDTVVVIGPRGRAHVFTHEGRQVTSLQLAGGELDRKVSLKRWQALSRERIERFRAGIAAKLP